MSRLCQSCIWSLVAFVGIVISNESPGHEDVVEQIQTLDHLILENPDEADHFLQRGNAYRIQQRWDLAWNDYINAEIRGADPDRLCWVRSKLCGDVGWLHAGYTYINQYLERRPKDADGWLWKAELCQRMSDWEEAYHSYQQGLTVAPHINSELLLPFISLCLHPVIQKPAVALSYLEKAIVELGPLPVLQNKRTALLLALNRVADVRADYEQRLNTAIGMQRVEPLIALGELDRSKNNLQAASRHFEEALDLLMQLPVTRQKTVAIAAQISQLQTYVKALAVDVKDVH